MHGIGNHTFTITVAVSPLSAAMQRQGLVWCHLVLTWKLELRHGRWTCPEGAFIHGDRDGNRMENGGESKYHMKRKNVSFGF